VAGGKYPHLCRFAINSILRVLAQSAGCDW
jgi:hypothetical protein